MRYTGKGYAVTVVALSNDVYQFFVTAKGWVGPCYLSGAFSPVK